MLVFLATGAGGWLAWLTHRARQQVAAVVALRELGVDTISEARDPEWLWWLFSERLRQTTVRASLYAKSTGAAIPHLKVLPDLREAVVVSWPWDRDLGTDAEALLHQEMPDLKTERHFLNVGWVTVAETVRVPHGSSVLLEGLRTRNEAHIPPSRIVIPEEE
jgi:hypothetical protein